MLLRFLIYGLFLPLFFVFEASSQEQKLPLKKILISIENQHQVTFSYLENAIENIEIIAPNAIQSFSEKLDFIQSQTNIEFEKTAEGYFSVLKSNSNQKYFYCGFIYSSVDKSPLENATIQLPNGSMFITNSLGYFEFSAVDISQITISYVGFIIKKIEISKSTQNLCKSYFLNPEINDLEEVVTNRYIATGISRSDDGSLLLKPKKLGILPGLIEADVLQTMQQIPGINSVDESVASINVRGGTNDQNLFLWNGIKMYQTGHFFGLISAFNPNLGQTIAISKNGTSAFFGNSVSSVIAIDTNPTTAEKNSFSASVNMINADIYSKINCTKNGFIEISGRKSMTEFLNTPTYKEYFNKAFQNTSITDFSNQQNTLYSSQNEFQFYDATVKYHQKINEKNLLIVDVITISDALDVLQTTNRADVIQSEKNNLTQKNQGANLHFSRQWNEQNSSKIDFFASHYQLNANKNRLEANQTLLQQNAILDTGFRMEHCKILSNAFVLKMGYQFDETGVTNLDQVNNPEFLRQIKEVLRSHALISEIAFTNRKSTVLGTFGLRGNYFEKLKRTLIEPRFHLKYIFEKHFDIGLLSELKSQTSFQVIDLQNDYFGIEKRRWILANNAKTPIQRSGQISINANFNKNQWLVSVENFYKKVTGINASGQGFQNQLEFSKINGAYSIFGTEVLVQKKIKNFLGWISYTYNDNIYDFTNFDPAQFVNNFNIRHTFNTALIYEKNNFKMALGSKWYSGKPYTTPSSSEVDTNNPLFPKIAYGAPNNAQLNSFFQVNFSTTYSWKNNGDINYKLGFSVLNIFNKNNEINEYYRINNVTNSIEDVKSFALKRTPNVSFKVSF